MNKYFFKKKSTLSYIEKLKNQNYTIKSRKNIRFFYVIERRLLVVLARLCIARITVQDQLRFLIESGYISVDNEIVKTPYYLTPHEAILRVLKTIPRALTRLPKLLIMNNLRWLYYKRIKKKLKKPLWRVVARRRPWFRPKARSFKFKKIILFRPKVRPYQKKKKTIPRKSKLTKRVKKKVWKINKKRRYFLGELKRRTRRYRWVKSQKLRFPVWVFIFNKPDRLTFRVPGKKFGYSEKNQGKK
jgi:hypothetical protein